jgi:cytochrome P450
MMRLDVATRRLSLDPRRPWRSFSNPYAAYAEHPGLSPVAFWEELGLWCFFAHEDVNRLLRDRRFGREILHLATREALGMAGSTLHTRGISTPWTRTRCWSGSRRCTRGCVRSSGRAFVSRRVEALRPAIERIGDTQLVDEFPECALSICMACVRHPYARAHHRAHAGGAGGDGAGAARRGRTTWWPCTAWAARGPWRSGCEQRRGRVLVRTCAILVAGAAPAAGDDLLSVLIAAEEQGDRLSGVRAGIRRRSCC